MTDLVLARRLFDEAAQDRFAALSGDVNPMHMDKMAARRTQPGAPVAHGVHLALWALDAAARAQALPAAPITSLKAQFSKFVYVGAEAAVVVAARREGALRLAVQVDGLTAASLTVGFGADAPAAGITAGERAPAAEAVAEPSFDQMASLSGRLSAAAPDAAFAADFPEASALIGADRVAALAALSSLVGMVCPGAHSIFGGFALEVVPRTGQPGVGFRTLETDARFRSVLMAVEGDGLRGEVKAFERQPPVAPPALSALAGRVAPGEFAGAKALVVGGSRGLGALTAKLLAAGGADLVLTYAVGRDDAEAVAAEARAAGREATTAAYDARRPPADQSLDLVGVTHLYYFATQTIYRPKATLFHRPTFDGFVDVYVDGFQQIVGALMAANGALSAFYPSTVFVETRPEGMTEYAMAKAAGETLCRDLAAGVKRLDIRVERLPRLPTDQTASLIAAEMADPVEVLLPLMRRLHAPR